MSDSTTYTPPSPVNLGSESSLSNWVGPYVTDMLGMGYAVGTQPYQSYAGPLTAGASDLQQQAFTGIASLDPNAGSFTPGSFTDEGVASTYMNPYVQQALNPTLDEMQRQAEIRRMSDASRLTQAGAFGGSRQAIIESELNRALMDDITGATYKAYADAYDKGANQYNTEQNLGLRSTMQNYGNTMDYYNNLMNLGGTQRGIEAEGIAADYAQFQEERDFPYQQVQYMQSLLQGLPLEAQTQVYSDVDPLSAGIGTAGGILGLLQGLGIIDGGN